MTPQPLYAVVALVDPGASKPRLSRIRYRDTAMPFNAVGSVPQAGFALTSACCRRVCLSRLSGAGADWPLPPPPSLS